MGRILSLETTTTNCSVALEQESKISALKEHPYGSIVDASSYAKYLNQGQVLFIGNVVEKFKELCSLPNAHFKETWPSAKDMVTLADRKYKISDTVDVAYFEPYYPKDFMVKKKSKTCP